MNSNRARAQRKVLNFSYTDYGLPGRQNRITGSGNSIWAYTGTATGSGKDFHAVSLSLPGNLNVHFCYMSRSFSKVSSENRCFLQSLFTPRVKNTSAGTPWPLMNWSMQKPSLGMAHWNIQRQPACRDAAKIQIASTRSRSRKPPDPRLAPGMPCSIQ